MNNEKLDKELRNRILKEIQHCDLTTLRDVKAGNPSFHWSPISYEKTGDTSLHIAARLSYLSVIDYLLQEFVPCAVDIRNNDDKTPLHEAAQFTQSDSVLKLSSYGADVNALRRGDWTPLMLACTKIKPEISLVIVKTLVNNGAHVNVRNKDGWTCVHIVAREGGDDIFNYLIDNGLQANVKTKNGRTALHIAALHGHKPLVSRLLLHVDINTKDSCGNTPLHEAILGKHINIARYLIQQGADIHLRNNSDISIVHLAACQDDLEVLEYVLYSLKFNVNCQNNLGWTPAHCAARKGLEEVFEYLKKCGADLSIKDNFGRVASDYLG